LAGGVRMGEGHGPRRIALEVARAMEATQPISDHEPAPEATSDPVAGAEALKEQVIEALRNVHDPELGINIVDLGLVYGVEVDADTVHVTYTLTTMGCPIGPLIEAEIKQFLSGVAGVSN